MRPSVTLQPCPFFVRHTTLVRSLPLYCEHAVKSDKGRNYKRPSFLMSAQEELPTQPEDLANFMDSIFAQMEQKFTDMAQQVLGRIDEMSSKINELEASIDQLMSQADAEAGGK